MVRIGCRIYTKKKSGAFSIYYLDLLSYLGVKWGESLDSLLPSIDWYFIRRSDTSFRWAHERDMINIIYRGRILVRDKTPFLYIPRGRFSFPRCFIGFLLLVVPWVFSIADKAAPPPPRTDLAGPFRQAWRYSFKQGCGVQHQSSEVSHHAWSKTGNIFQSSQ